jgi:hypothetical protein
MANGMKMTVIFPNGEVGTVPKDSLDSSIRAKKIIAFLRSSGWVQVDRDPIRLAQIPLKGSGKRVDDSSLSPSPSDTSEFQGS